MRSGVRNQRAIVDRRRLIGTLKAIADVRQSGEKQRAAVLDRMKAALGAGDEVIRRRFSASDHNSAGRGAEVVTARCFLVDQLIRILYDFAVENLKVGGTS